MVAYSFERRHHDDILLGAKPFTIRQLGKKRHARIGEEIQFRDGRTGPKFAVADCVFRARILFAERGLVRLLNVNMLDAGDLTWRVFTAAEQGSPQAAEHLEKLAKLDGFDTWADLYRWHAEQGGADENGLLDREVIGWASALALSTGNPEPV